ncbi:protein EMBRYO DEFECTIVE 1674 [Corylus avellana]|uniref:protein EMBRYO DEFECTIVE 1674 n=1 Tax=Corylus avellana TaxID=13451 RepID=UPI00286C9D97|nr:protein EMBRYO DEFECTIVE 1674 [Corylus avellana]
MAKTRRNRGFPTPPNPKASPKPITPTSNTTIVSSSLYKSVSLHDWWLVKAPNGKGLAVGGFASLERLGVRVFSSAAISKRHDATTLETTDGINITISGFINRSRSCQNGFPSEVCNHFLLGFPWNWEEYAIGCSGENSTGRGVPTRISASDESKVSSGDNADKTFPFSLHDFPVARVRDLLISTFEDPDYCLLTKSIYNDILGKSMGNSPMKNVQSGLNETPVNQKETKVDHKHDNEDTFFNSRDMTTEENQNVLTPSIGVSTRSMTRLKNFRMEQEERLSPNSKIKQATGKRIGGMVKTNAPMVSHPTKLFEKDKEFLVVSDKSVVRRSRRLMNPKK